VETLSVHVCYGPAFARETGDDDSMNLNDDITNTALAHRPGRTNDWIVIHFDHDHSSLYVT